MIRILTKNGVDNTNVDGARDHNFNAGRRSGIVQGALNQGNFFASNNNTIALDTCELRLCGHRIVLDKAEYRTFTNKPSVPVRYSFVARVVVDSDDNVSFEFVTQEATTQLVQDNLDITGSGTYELEIGKFTQLTDGNITDVVRTADLITGGADNDSDYIRIGTVTTNKISPELDADVDIENIINPADNKPQTNFTFNLPTPSGTVVSLNGVEKTSINTDLTPTANSSNLITSGGVHDYPAITFAESERQKSKNLFNINKLSFNYVPGSYSINYNTGTITFVDSGANSTSDLRLKDFTDLKAGKTYRLSYAYTGTPTNLFIYLNGSDTSWLNGDTHTITQAELDSGIHMYGNPAGTVTISDIIMVEDGVDIDYQPYNGQISHTGDKEIEFARDEYEKSKNLLNATTSETTLGNMTFSADTSNIYFNGSYTDADRCMFNSWALKKGTYTLNIEYISGSITRFENILFYIYKGGSWTQYSEAINLSSSNKAGSVSFTLDEDVNDARLTLYQNLTNTMTNCVFKYQIVEGTNSDFDFQPYNGAIVHKSEVEPILIYDIDTKNTIGGTAYTSGINYGTTINYDFTPYKKLKIYAYRHQNGPFTYEINLEQKDFGQNVYSGSGICYSYQEGDNYFVYSSASISDNKQQLRIIKCGYTLDFFTTPTLSTTCYIYRLEGYK